MPPEKTLPVGHKDSEFEDDRPSRSQKKRDSTALQRMGEELTTLGSSVLAKMPLTPNIREAVLEWQRLSSHEGRRRQMQYIGRLMREEADPQAVRDALDAIKLGHTGETASFKRSEKLRDDLMNATDAEMDTLLAAFSAEDATEIRDLTAKARNEREHSRPPHAYRALFRKLKKPPGRTMIRDAIILGAGAAGLMCSMTAGRRGFSCAVIDHSPVAGRKAAPCRRRQGKRYQSVYISGVVCRHAERLP